MKVVFFGTPPPAVPTLAAVVEAGHDVRAVVTRPDRPVGRSGRARPPAVKVAAHDAGLPVLQPERPSAREMRERLAATEPDVFVVVAYGKILSRRTLAVPRIAPVNLHFSLLPSYRGAAPVQWALANGDRRTGVTTIRMNERMDEGDVLQSECVAIGTDEHAPALSRRLADLGADLVVSTLTGLERGTIEPRPQDPTHASIAPLLRVEDGEIDWDLTAREIVGRVRGFDPWPGVWVGSERGRLRLLAAKELDGASDGEAPPGTVLRAAGAGVVVAGADGGRLRLDRVMPEGKRAMGARDAVNGRQIRIGERLRSLRADA